MRFVKVTSLPNDNYVVIELENESKKKTFRRPIDEFMAKTVSRMMCSMEQKQKKKKKKKSKLDQLHSLSDDETSSTVIKLFDTKQQEVSLNQEGLKAWKLASYMHINDDIYPITYNPPTVKKIALSSLPLVGIPMVPILQFSLAFSQYSRFTWYRSVETYTKIENMKKSSNCEVLTRKRQLSSEENVSKNGVSHILQDKSEWIQVGTDLIYTPTDDDVGHVIMLEVVPGSEVYPATECLQACSPVLTKSGIVHHGPTTCIFDKRHVNTREPCSNKNMFRLVCYNILADCYADTEFALSNLFPYCSKDTININYRLQLVQKEVLGYHADIVCLQEVDRFVFEDCLAPTFSLHQYAAAFANKKNTKEGVALFYNRAKFRLLSVENKVVSESLTKDEVNKNLHEFVKSNSNLQSRVASLGTCALMCDLQSVEDENRYVIVVTTHLYYHPRAANIRLIQILVIMNLLKKKLENLKESLGEDSIISCIVCGDFNSNPRTALVEFMLSGKLPHYHSDWYSGGLAEFHNSKTSFTHDFDFKSACGFPPYTNYAAGFNDCLDYVFIDADKLSVKRVIDPPDHNSVVEYSGLPSPTAPSDHVAQVVDLSWLPRTD